MNKLIKRQLLIEKHLHISEIELICASYLKIYNKYDSTNLIVEHLKNELAQEYVVNISWGSRLYVYKNNCLYYNDTGYTILKLTENDVKNKSIKYAGTGYEILVLPFKYKNVHNEYLDMVRLIAEARCGKVVYV